MDGLYFLVMCVAIGWLAVWSVIEPDSKPDAKPDGVRRRYVRKRTVLWSPFDMREPAVPEPAPEPRPDLPPWRRRR